MNAGRPFGLGLLVLGAVATWGLLGRLAADDWPEGLFGGTTAPGTPWGQLLVDLLGPPAAAFGLFLLWWFRGDSERGGHRRRRRR